MNCFFHCELSRNSISLRQNMAKFLSFSLRHLVWNPNKYPHRYRNAALIEIQYSLFRTWIQCLSSCRLFNLKFSIYYCLHMVSFRENAWNIAITFGLWYIYMWCDPICGHGIYCRFNQFRYARNSIDTRSHFMQIASWVNKFFKFSNRKQFNFRPKHCNYHLFKVIANWPVNRWCYHFAKGYTNITFTWSFSFDWEDKKDQIIALNFKNVKKQTCTWWIIACQRYWSNSVYSNDTLDQFQFNLIRASLV